MDSFSLFHSFLQRNRRGPFRRKMAAVARTIVNAWENRSYDHEVNGEGQVLSATGRLNRVILDVGANVGGWAAVARRASPLATIHCFEIVPQTVDQLRKNLGADPNIRINGFGLGEATREIEVRYYRDAPRQSSAFATMDRPSVLVRSRIMNGDEYLRSASIEYVDFLKVDTEGMDGQVLRGFGGALRERRIRVIQFEYGRPNIASRFLLADFHALLEPNGYVVGKIFPRSVEFRSYRAEHEDFEGPNFLAVDANENELIEALSRA